MHFSSEILFNLRKFQNYSFKNRKEYENKVKISKFISTYITFDLTKFLKKIHKFFFDNNTDLLMYIIQGDKRFYYLLLNVISEYTDIRNQISNAKNYALLNILLLFI